MANSLNLIKALIVASAVFAIAFAAVFSLLAGEAHRNYGRLLKAWNTAAIPLLELRDASSKASRETRDENVQFVAKHLATTASIRSDLGYKRLADVNTTSIEYFGRAFIQGYVNPAINLKTIPLWWNAKEFEAKAKLLDARHKRMEMLRWILSGGIALLSSWWIFRKRRATSFLPARQVESLTPERT